MMCVKHVGHVLSGKRYRCALPFKGESQDVYARIFELNVNVFFLFWYFLFFHFDKLVKGKEVGRKLKLMLF